MQSVDVWVMTVREIVAVMAVYLGVKREDLVKQRKRDEVEEMVP